MTVEKCLKCGKNIIVYWEYYKDFNFKKVILTDRRGAICLNYNHRWVCSKECKDKLSSK